MTIGSLKISIFKFMFSALLKVLNFLLDKNFTDFDFQCSSCYFFCESVYCRQIFPPEPAFLHTAVVK